MIIGFACFRDAYKARNWLFYAGVSFYVPFIVSVIILIVSKFNSFTLGLCILTLLQSIVIVMVFGSFIVTDLVG